MPTKLVEIIPKEKSKSPLLAQIMFYVSLLMLTVGVAAFLGLNIHLKSLEQKKLTLKNQIEAAYQIPKEKRVVEKLGKTKRKIETLKEVLKDHKALSQIIPRIASLVHSEAQLTSLKVDLLENKVLLSGVAPDPKVIAQQFLILEGAEDVKEVVLSPVSLDPKEEFRFDISFSFSPQIVEMPGIARLFKKESGEIFSPKQEFSEEKKESSDLPVSEKENN